MSKFENCTKFYSFYLGDALCQSVPSLKTVPRTVFKFTPCRGLVYRGVSLTAVSDQRLCLMESASLVRLERTFNELRNIDRYGNFNVVYYNLSMLKNSPFSAAHTVSTDYTI